MEISGSGAMIVGGASGMARATAERLHERGAKIAIVDLPTSDGEAVAGSYRRDDLPHLITTFRGVPFALVRKTIPAGTYRPGHPPSAVVRTR